MHPAKKYNFDHLVSGLEAEVANKNVNKNQGSTGLVLYNYTQACCFNKSWNDFSIISRGLILHPPTKSIVALPFPKFFNYGEHGDLKLPDIPFVVTEKMDGSLGIIYYWDDKWCVATRGSLNSMQAQDANKMLARIQLEKLNKDVTYLAEIIYPENRIVINYGDLKGLVFLSGYNRVSGMEISREELSVAVDDKTVFLVKERVFKNGLADILELAKVMPESEEGFVVRFEDGYRVKIKGDAYCRIHRMISGVTPINLWMMLLHGDDSDTILKNLPEEFRLDFENIIKILENRRDSLIASIEKLVEEYREMSDKDLGMIMPELQKTNNHARFLFSWRHGRTDKDPLIKKKIFAMFRPTGNRLDGYEPTNVMNRFTDES